MKFVLCALATVVMMCSGCTSESEAACRSCRVERVRTVERSCGQAAETSCGRAEASCSYAEEASCGRSSRVRRERPEREGLFSRLRSHRNEASCGSSAPSCGVAAPECGDELNEDGPVPPNPDELSAYGATRPTLTGAVNPTLFEVPIPEGLR